LKGRQLTLVPSDELTFATWKAEEPWGTVLKDVPKYVSEYESKDWDVRIKRAPVVLPFAEHGMKARDLVLGIQAFGASRALLYDQVLKEKLVQDHVGAEPVGLVVSEDNQSVRLFRDRIAGVEGAPDYYRMGGKKTGVLMMDDGTGSEWNFEGCAVSGKAKGGCLDTAKLSPSNGTNEPNPEMAGLFVYMIGFQQRQAYAFQDLVEALEAIVEIPAAHRIELLKRRIIRTRKADGESCRVNEF
jgi:Protein of unknown function (DUF3179)